MGCTAETMMAPYVGKSERGLVTQMKTSARVSEHDGDAGAAAGDGGGFGLGFGCDAGGEGGGVEAVVKAAADGVSDGDGVGNTKEKSDGSGGRDGDEERGEGVRLKARGTAVEEQEQQEEGDVQEGKGGEDEDVTQGVAALAGESVAAQGDHDSEIDVEEEEEGSERRDEVIGAHARQGNVADSRCGARARCTDDTAARAHVREEQDAPCGVSVGEKSEVADAGARYGRQGGGPGLVTAPTVARSEFVPSLESRAARVGMRRPESAARRQLGWWPPVEQQVRAAYWCVSSL